MTKAFIQKPGEPPCEVVSFHPEIDRMGLLRWDDEDHGLLFPIRITEANREGYQPVAKEIPA